MIVRHREMVERFLRTRGRSEHMEDGTFEEIKEGIEAGEICIGNETYLYSISDGNMKKEQV